jgi:ATP-dependent Lon protease
MKRHREIEESSDEDYVPYENKVRRCMKSQEPNISQIVNTPLLPEDKCELVELFEIYKMIEEPTLEKLDIRKRIHSKYKESVLRYSQHARYSESEHLSFSKQMTELEQHNTEEDMKYQILKLNTTQQNKRVIYNEYIRMCQLNHADEELPKLRNWLNWAINLPYDNMKLISVSKHSETIQKVLAYLNENLYGMEKVKEQILVFLNTRIMNPQMKRCSLGLIGPPGCGKTRIAQLIAEVMDYPLQQISLGGIRNPEFLKGQQYTYIGSEPGEIVRCIRKMGAKNGILFFDEYDKISENKDVCSALLHITDPVQNDKFQDNFLSSINIDLSYIWFFYSMNQKPTDDALADRVFYIHIDGYTQDDKFQIVKNYLLKQAHVNMGWKPNSVSFHDTTIRNLIEIVSPTTDKGVRTLEHAVFTIVNKINFLYHNQNKNGKLPYSVSFDIQKKVAFPFCLMPDKLTFFIN